MKFTIKIIAALTLLTFMIIVASLYTQSYLGKTSIKLEKQVHTLQVGINAEDWETVGINLDSTIIEWEQSKKTWAMLIDHLEIDNIDETLSRMKEYINARDVPSALAEASALSLYFRHIPAKESLSIENIF